MQRIHRSCFQKQLQIWDFDAGESEFVAHQTTIVSHSNFTTISNDSGRSGKKGKNDSICVETD